MANQESEEKINHFNRLPEGCIADTISYTTPVDACRLALISPSFRLIADSDAVWERFLPSDYTQIISRADQLLPISPKKNLYLSLCDHPLTIDAGALSFSLDKLTGKKCIVIAAKELAIVDGDDSKNVEIHGRISTSLLSPYTTYTTYLVYKPSTEIWRMKLQRSDFVMGINGEAAFITFHDVLFLHQCEYDGVKKRFSRIGRRSVLKDERPDDIWRYPGTRKDGWSEIELGEYFNEEGEKNRELNMRLNNVWHSWMSYYIIQGLELRPKGSSKSISRSLSIYALMSKFEEDIKKWRFKNQETPKDFLKI